MPKPTKANRHEFLSYASVNPTRHNILRAMAGRAACDPPLDTAPDDVYDELASKGLEVYRTQVNREFEDILGFRLLEPAKEGRKLTGRFEFTEWSLPWWRATHAWAEATAGLFPPEPGS